MYMSTRQVNFYLLWDSDSVEFTDMHVALLANLSGLHANLSEASDVHTQMFYWLYRATWHRQPSGFVYRFIATPCQFADRLSYLFKVTFSFHSDVTEQEDRIVLSRSKTEAISYHPEIDGSPYLKWTGSRGFGVFLGTLSRSVNSRTRIDTTCMLGTYGGLVSTYEEASNTRYCLTIPGVTTLHQFPFRVSQKDGAEVPVIDGTALGAGDGGVFNSSCCPTVETFVKLHSLPLCDNTDLSMMTRQGVKLFQRREIMYFKLCPYVFVFFAIT